MIITADHGSHAGYAPSSEVEDWRERARCKGVDVNVFFPPASGPAMYDQARTYCASCPVRVECLEESISYGFAWREDGFRGGMTPRQRANLRGVRVRMIERVCQWCGADFGAVKSTGPRLAAYCSDPCRNEARRMRAKLLMRRQRSA